MVGTALAARTRVAHRLVPIRKTLCCLLLKLEPRVGIDVLRPSERGWHGRVAAPAQGARCHLATASLASPPVRSVSLLPYLASCFGGKLSVWCPGLSFRSQQP